MDPQDPATARRDEAESEGAGARSLSAAAVAPFEALTDVVVVMSTDGTILYVNAYAAHLLGVDRDEVPGRSIAEFVHPDDLLRALEVLDLMLGGSLEVAITPAQYRLRHADGTWWPIEINASSWTPPGSDTELMLVIGRYSGDQDVQDRVLELLTSGAPVEEVIDLIPSFGSWRHPTEHYAVLLLDPTGQVARASGSELAASMVEVARADTAPAPWDLASRRGEDVLAWTDDLSPSLREAAVEEELAGCWAVPVRDRSGAATAVVVAWAREHGPAPPVHRYSLEIMARALVLIIQWAQQLSDLERAAREDALTGVTNRSRFFELLAEAPRDGLVAVLYVDLDGFKAVNDLHGHTLGDVVLQQVADRICTAVGDDGVAGRIGGDEFAVLLAGLSDPAAAAEVAERIIEAVQQPIAVEGLTLSVGASVGVAVTDASSPAVDRLVERADRALYEAKAAGRGRWSLDADPV